MTKTCTFLPKWWNFAKSGHTCSTINLTQYNRFHFWRQFQRIRYFEIWSRWTRTRLEQNCILDTMDMICNIKSCCFILEKSEIIIWDRFHWENNFAIWSLWQCSHLKGAMTRTQSGINFQFRIASIIFNNAL